MKTRCNLRRISSALLILSLFAANFVNAALPPYTEGIIELPEKAPIQQGPTATVVAARSGLELSVDTRWADGFGYRPTHFTFTSTKPAASDYQIAIRLYVNRGARQVHALEVEQVGVLRAGEQSTTIILRTPQYESWTQLQWDIVIDGFKEPALSLDSTRPFTLNHWQQNGLTLYYPRVGNSAAPPFTMTASPDDSFAGMQVNRCVGPFPTNWLDFTCFDSVVMTFDEFVAANTDPERLSALRRWVSAGGNLWIENAGESDENLAAIDEVLQLGNQATSIGSDTDAAQLPSGWSYFKLRALQNANQNSQEPGTQAPIGSSTDSSTNVPPAVPPILESMFPQIASRENTHDWFVERPAGLGSVTAFATQWDAEPENLERGMRGLVRDRWVQRSWLMRHGFAPNVPTLDFANFLIPGVGLAPVTEFQVLITIFVLLIGPLNYWVLSRAKRLYLLVVTVPLGAAAVTLLIFSYAFLADGFATQVRSRSITLIDQPMGEAASWSRFTYYAGFAPAEGLIFPDDTAVYPIVPETAGLRSRLRPDDRVIEWRDREQDFARGWLPSRTPTQFLAVRAHETTKQLEVRAATARCQVTNKLGDPLKWLIVVDESGRMWHGAEIDRSERRELASTPAVDILGELREALIANKPQLPPELQATVSTGRLDQRQGRGRYGQYRFSDVAPEYHLYSSLMEKRFEYLMESLGGAARDNFPPRTFLAVSTTSIDVPLALDDVEEVDGFHVIIGRW